jgi:hypothetical protein
MATTINADDGAVSGSAGLKYSSDSTGVLALQTNGTTAVTVGTDQSVTFAQAANLPNTFGFKNRLINGAMVISQRNAGASVTLATGPNYVVDRLNMHKGTAGATVTGQQASASIAGFEKCAVWTTTVASAPAAGDINGIWQVIEGLNTLDLQWGTANAKACTVSFWFKATTSGTYALSILSGGGDLSYVATFSATSTFTYFSFSIPAPTTGTFYKNTLAAMYVTIDAGSGTDYSTATTGSWIAGNFKRTSACVNSTANTNTLSLTGFQFEVGSTATSFDYRPYGTELALCQRYYEKSFEIGTAPASAGSAAGAFEFAQQVAASAQQYGPSCKYAVVKRGTPTATFYNWNAAGNEAVNVVTGGTTTSLALRAGQSGTSSFSITFIAPTGTSVGQGLSVQWTADSEL